MGIAPSEVLSMSLYDYQAALHHWAKAQGSDDDEVEALTPEEFDELLITAASQGVH
ncbi:hypothetical protein [Novosphingobium pentaromativorans]|uniref:Uncharacterized protein n=1 Tax=Novosphingobium pentaromativorans US6-1 TaxID=1088721 RepID=G6E7K6_9SPHN|nr:hypothetical protein [Novosphingobium pentaromativorans]EHJ62829.1 hypothetical protein NSU_0341 [Novosphingobium pentaromativorans US6-1]